MANEPFPSLKLGAAPGRHEQAVLDLIQAKIRRMQTAECAAVARRCVEEWDFGAAVYIARENDRRERFVRWAVGQGGR